MTIGDKISTIKGYVTQDKFLVGRSLEEIERVLGFHTGRLSRGAVIAKLTSLPGPDEFELAGYSITPGHRHVVPAGLDQQKLKGIAITRWSLAGPARLVKVMPHTNHDPRMDADDQYPVGAGVPQWNLQRLFEGVVVAEPATWSVTYRPAC